MIGHDCPDESVVLRCVLSHGTKILHLPYSHNWARFLRRRSRAPTASFYLEIFCHTLTSREHHVGDLNSDHKWKSRHIRRSLYCLKNTTQGNKLRHWILRRQFKTGTIKVYQIVLPYLVIANSDRYLIHYFYDVIQLSRNVWRRSIKWIAKNGYDARNWHFNTRSSY